MEYLIRLAQMHETFRRPELEALAVLHNVDLEILEYSDEVRASKTFHSTSRMQEGKSRRALERDLSFADEDYLYIRSMYIGSFYKS
jgi:tRNA G10  N-methylase Trm11